MASRALDQTYTIALCVTWRFTHRQEVHPIRSDVVMCEKHFKIERLGNGIQMAWIIARPQKPLQW